MITREDAENKLETQRANTIRSLEKQVDAALANWTGGPQEVPLDQILTLPLLKELRFAYEEKGWHLRSETKNNVTVLTFT